MEESVIHIGIGDGIARLSGLSKCQSSEMLVFPNGEIGIALNIESDSVGAIIIGDYKGIKEGHEVRRTGKILQVPVGEQFLGRVIDALGKPLDGKGSIAAESSYPMEKPHGLDDVTKKLYSRDEKALPPHRTGVLHKVQQTAATVWNSERQEKMNETIATLSTSATHTSFFKKFFIASGIFFLVALTIGAYLFFAGGRSVSAQNVSINILGNAFTPGGEPLPLTLELGNRNTIPLQLVDLIVEYPKSGTSLSGNPSDIARIRQPIGIKN
jgi:hypothetical protein